MHVGASDQRNLGFRELIPLRQPELPRPVPLRIDVPGEFMASWYKHDIASWMDGTEDLSDGCYRVYHVICQLIYLHEGPITNNEGGLAGRCNQHILSFRANLQKLIDLKKINLEGGKLSNARADLELSRIHVNRKPRSNPPPTSVQPPSDLPRTPRGSHLQVIENTAPEKQTRLEEKRKESSAASAAPPKVGKRVPMPHDFQATDGHRAMALEKNFSDARFKSMFSAWKSRMIADKKTSANWSVSLVSHIEQQSFYQIGYDERSAAKSTADRTADPGYGTNHW